MMREAELVRRESSQIQGLGGTNPIANGGFNGTDLATTPRQKNNTFIPRIHTWSEIIAKTHRDKDRISQNIRMRDAG
jgi:hypothetical protein